MSPTKPLKFRPWRPPLPKPEEPEDPSEFIFYTPPTPESKPIDPHPALGKPSNWSIGQPGREPFLRPQRITQNVSQADTRKNASPYRQVQPPQATALAVVAAVQEAPQVTIHQAPVLTHQEARDDVDDTRINYIRLVPKPAVRNSLKTSGLVDIRNVFREQLDPRREQLGKSKTQTGEDLDDDALAEQQLIMEYSRTLKPARLRPRKQTHPRIGKKLWKYLSPDQGTSRTLGGSVRNSCNEDPAALATGAVSRRGS